MKELIRKLATRFEPVALLLGTAAVALAGLGMVGASVPASATTASHSVAHRIGSSKLCIIRDHAKCITGHGDGNPITMQSSGISTFNEIFVNGGIIFKTPNGLCLHGTNTNAVTLSSSCGNANTASQWDNVTCNGFGVFANVAYSGIVQSTADANGARAELNICGANGDWAIGVEPS